MKRLISIILSVLLVTALLTGCAGGSTNEIRIGINYELSGEAATYGQSSAEGIELAIEQINAAGGINGKKIKPIKYDTMSDPAEATTLATKLKTQDKVLVVLGPATSGSFMAQIPVANDNKIPVIGSERGQVDAGAIATKGIDYKELGRQTGQIAVKIIKGKKPQDIPIEGSKVVTLIVNQKAAETIDLTIPKGILDKADEIIK